MVNEPLLVKTLAVIEDEVSRGGEGWRQAMWVTNIGQLKRAEADEETHLVDEVGNAWSCDTAMCFAGWAAVLDGAKLVVRTSPHINYLDCGAVMTPDGKLTAASTYAQKALGLGDWDAGRLFNASNTLAEIREIVAEIIG